MDCLIHCPLEPYNKNVYLVRNGTRRAVLHSETLERLGKSVPGDVTQVSAELLVSIPIGAPIARVWPEETFFDPPRISSIDVREILGSRCTGVGLEFGAGSSPFPLHLDALATYVDVQQKIKLEATLYPGQSVENLVNSSMHMGIERLIDWPTSTLDFVVACHVIEHTPNPMAAIVGAFNALRLGGVLLLVVPDKHRTFDRHRELTTVDHLILDHVSPDKVRDLDHFMDYGKRVLGFSEADLTKYAANAQENKTDIHYHVWDYRSFGSFIDEIEHFSKIKWSVKHGVETLDDDGNGNNIEFYYFLQK